MTVEEARGMIPLHPNCRCAWMPVTPEGAVPKAAVEPGLPLEITPSPTKLPSVGPRVGKPSKPLKTTKLKPKKVIPKVVEKVKAIDVDLGAVKPPAGMSTKAVDKKLKELLKSVDDFNNAPLSVRSSKAFQKYYDDVLVELKKYQGYSKYLQMNPRAVAAPVQTVDRMTQKAWLESLSEKQKASFKFYSVDGYQDIAQVQKDFLLGKLTKQTAEKWQMDFLSHASNLERAIDSAPSVKRSIFRGMHFYQEDNPAWKALRKKLMSGKSFSFDSVQSFSYKRATADRFAKKGKVQVVIRMKKAPKRCALMEDLSMSPKEHEVLVGCDSSYQVTNVVEKWDDVEEVWKVICDMVEMTP